MFIINNSKQQSKIKQSDDINAKCKILKISVLDTRKCIRDQIILPFNVSNVKIIFLQKQTPPQQPLIFVFKFISET